MPLAQSYKTGLVVDLFRTTTDASIAKYTIIIVIFIYTECFRCGGTTGKGVNLYKKINGRCNNFSINFLVQIHLPSCCATTSETPCIHI